MDTPRALIADDEINLANDLQRRLNKLWPELEIVAVVHNGRDAIEQIELLEPDIAFLDIQMPGLSGLEVALGSLIPHLVFVTAFDQYAVEAFERAAVDYLLKPASDERLQQTIDRLKDRIHTRPEPADMLAALRQLIPSHAPAPLRWIKAGVGADTHFVVVDEVVYFHADDKYTVVTTRDREYLIRTPLKELLPQLDPENFWQIHRSYIVNTKYIANARRELSGRVTLSLKHRTETLTVSRAYAGLFKQM